MANLRPRPQSGSDVNFERRFTCKHIAICIARGFVCCVWSLFWLPVQAFDFAFFEIDFACCSMNAMRWPQFPIYHLLCFTQQNYLRVYVFVLCEEECYVSFAGSDAILSLRLFTRVPLHALAASSNLRSLNLSLLFHTSKACMKSVGDEPGIFVGFSIPSFLS